VTRLLVVKGDERVARFPHHDLRAEGCQRKMLHKTSRRQQQQALHHPGLQHRARLRHPPFALKDRTKVAAHDTCDCMFTSGEWQSVCHHSSAFPEKT
jgi:hypothetical protein